MVEKPRSVWNRVDHAQVMEHCLLQGDLHLTEPAGLYYDTLAYGIVVADRLKVQG